MMDSFNTLLCFLNLFPRPWIPRFSVFSLFIVPPYKVIIYFSNVMHMWPGGNQEISIVYNNYIVNQM